MSLMDENNRHLKDGAYREIHHELRDVTFRPIVGFCIGLFLLVALCFWVTRAMFNYFAAREGKSASIPSLIKEKPQLPPEPRLQVLSAQDRAQVRAAEESVLHSYGWVNPSSGIVRIPIERAMQLVVERGLPPVSASEEKKVVDSHSK
jgi:hypothetical protein